MEEQDYWMNDGWTVYCMFNILIKYVSQAKFKARILAFPVKGEGIGGRRGEWKNKIIKVTVHHFRKLEVP